MSTEESLVPAPLLEHDKYRIAVVCTLREEAVAVQSAFDHTFLDQLEQPEVVEGDDNSYSFGVIGRHHVVLAHTRGDKGNIKSSTIAVNLSRSFQRIKLCLLVGTCAIVPMIPDEDKDEEPQEALMGDVVISNVVKEYSYGKEYPSGFKRIDLLSSVSSRERNEYARQSTPVQARYLRTQLKRFLLELEQKEDLGSYGYPGHIHDILQHTTNIHRHRSDCESCAGGKMCESAMESSCEFLGCDSKGIVERERTKNIMRSCHRLKDLDNHMLEQILPRIHFGDIASGEKILKNAHLRDQIAKSNDVIAFEMEGAGVCQSLPTVVIKAACNYGDSHKSQKWYKYACMTAAACSKAFIKNMQMGIRPNVQFVPKDKPQIVDSFQVWDPSGKNVGSISYNYGLHFDRPSEILSMHRVSH